MKARKKTPLKQKKAATVNQVKTESLSVTGKVASKWGGCPVCGMDSWCGSSGCPLDPT